MLKADRLASRLKEIAGRASVIQVRDELESYALNGKHPKVVVSPKTVEEVSKIVAYANMEDLALVPMGNGTKMGMGGIPRKMDMILQTNRLNRIIDCEIENLTLTVEGGITLSQIQRHLAREGKGYFLPLDPPFMEKATIGGIVATNSSGPRRFLYGTARDLIIGMKVVLPNGDVMVSGGKTVKNVSGYDMCKLLIGSFGTLGIICEMTFKVLPLPETEATLVVPFGTLEEADAFVREILRSQLLPAAIETLNAPAARQMRFDLLPRGGNYVLVVGLEGVEESTERQMDDMRNLAKKLGALQPVILKSERHHAFWRAFRDFPMTLVKRYADPVALKSNFLVSKCAQMMGSHERIVRGFGMDCALICRSGNGILYTYVLPKGDGRLRLELLIELIKKLTSEAAKNEGNAIIESSPWSIKKKINPWGRSRSDLAIMRRIKKEIDPRGILNPGRFVGGI